MINNRLIVHEFQFSKSLTSPAKADVHGWRTGLANDSVTEFQLLKGTFSPWLETTLSLRTAGPHHRHHPHNHRHRHDHHHDHHLSKSDHLSTGGRWIVEPEKSSGGKDLTEEPSWCRPVPPYNFLRSVSTFLTFACLISFWYPRDLLV